MLTSFRLCLLPNDDYRIWASIKPYGLGWSTWDVGRVKFDPPGNSHQPTTLFNYSLNASWFFFISLDREPLGLSIGIGTIIFLLFVSNPINLLPLLSFFCLLHSSLSGVFFVPLLALFC